MRSSKAAARAAELLGALAVVAIPVGVLLAQQLQSLRLLETLYAVVPLSVLLGLLAVALSRRARFAAARSVRADAAPLRLARFLAWAGTYVGVTGALALAVYGILRYAQG